MASPYDKARERAETQRKQARYERHELERAQVERDVRAFIDTGDITGPDGTVYKHRVYATARRFDADELRLNGLPADYYEQNPSADPRSH